LFEHLASLLTSALAQDGEERAVTVRCAVQQQVVLHSVVLCLVQQQQQQQQQQQPTTAHANAHCCMLLRRALVCKIEEINTTLRKHLAKEEAQLLPLLLHHFSAAEQAELVAQFLYCIPLATGVHTAGKCHKPHALPAASHCCCCC
jgi:hypothetical protein